MEIVKANLPENADMETLYNMFESEDRIPMKDLAGTIIHVKYFAIYTDENAKGEDVKLLAIMPMADDGEVAVTNSASAIRAMERLVTLCEMANRNLTAVEIVKCKSRNNREFITLKLA